MIKLENLSSFVNDVIELTTCKDAFDRRTLETRVADKALLLKAMLDNFNSVFPGDVIDGQCQESPQACGRIAMEKDSVSATRVRMRRESGKADAVPVNT